MKIKQLFEIYETLGIEVDEIRLWRFGRSERSYKDIPKSELAEMTLRKQFPNEVILDIDKSTDGENDIKVVKDFLESNKLGYLHKKFETQQVGHFHLFWDKEIFNRGWFLEWVSSCIGSLLTGKIDPRLKNINQAIQLEYGESFSTDKYPGQKQTVNLSNLFLNKTKDYPLLTKDYKLSTIHMKEDSKTEGKTEQTLWTAGEVFEKSEFKNYAFEEGISVIKTIGKINPNQSAELVTVKDGSKYPYLVTNDKIIRAADGHGSFKEIQSAVEKILHSETATRMRMRLESTLRSKTNYFLLYRRGTRHYKWFRIDSKDFQKYKKVITKGSDEEIINCFSHIKDHVVAKDRETLYRSDARSQVDQWVQRIKEGSLDYLTHDEYRQLGLSLCLKGWQKEKIKDLMKDLRHKKTPEDFETQYKSWTKYLGELQGGDSNGATA